MKQDVISFVVPTVILMLVSYYLQSTMIFSPDVGYLLHAANQMLEGGNYVSEIFETNPPMILYLYFPVCLFVKLTSVDIITAARIYVFFLAALSSIICWIILKKLIKPADFVYQYSLFYALLIILFILPLNAFAQREHMLIIFLMPYLFAAALTLENKSIHPGLACYIGVLAGVGFALKPFFLVTLCLIELNFIFKKHRLFAWVRIESLVVASVLIIYLCSIWIFHSGYFNIILPLVFHYYFPVIKKSWLVIFSYSSVTFCLVVIFSYIFIRKNDKYRNLGDTVFLALLGMTVAFLIPRAAWYYHIIPALGLAFLMVAHYFGQSLLALSLGSQSRWKMVRELGLLVTVTVLVLSAPLYNSYQIFKFMQIFAQANPANKLTAYINSRPGTHSVYCFTSTGTYRCFPMVYQTKSQYGQRFPFFWWYTGLRFAGKQSNNNMLSQRIEKDKNYLIDSVAYDLDRFQAKWVIIDSDSFKKIENNDFDLIAFFSGNEKFRNAWQQYGYLTHIGNYQIYERKR